MVKIKRIIAVVILVILLLSSVQNVAQAVTLKQDVNIYQIGKCDYTLQYKRPDGVWSYITCTYVVYQENGKTYPAYCLNRELDGVGEIDNYDVNLEKLIDDVRLWRVAINGFPYKSAAELGVYNDYDAFLATKQAIYSILYDWDVETRFRGGNERGVKVHEAMKKMVYEGRYGTYTPQSANVKVDKTGELKDEGDYYSQEYTVSSLVEMSQYTITNIINCPNGAYITDMSNNSKTTFNAGEHFKLRIPKNAISNDINVRINVQTKCKTYPIFFGKTYLEGTQDYLIITDPFGDEVGQATLNIKTNTGKVIVNKTDDETKEPIEGVTFGLYKTDGTEVARATTDSKGVAIFANLYQNNYVLKEISTNEKYILNTMEFDVNVTYNKTTTINVENEHKKGQVKVVKIDKDNNEVKLEGVTFEVYDEQKNLVDTLTTDENGEAVSKKLPIDQEYTVKETRTGETYVLSEEPQKVILEQDQIKTLTFENEKKKGQIEIIKVDAENQEVKLEGVTFEILDKDGNLVDTVITDEEGKAVTKELPIDSEYIVREKETRKEYVLSDEIVKVVLEENEIKSITFENIKIKGSIKILKVSNGDNQVLNIPDGTPLAGAEFTIVDANGNTIGIYETDENGTVQIDNILYGEYTIYESEVPEGYLMDAEPQTIFIAEDGEVIETIFKDSPIEPELPKTGIDININAAIIFVVLFSVASIMALIRKYRKMEE